MEKVSLLVGKPVVSVFEGKMIGYVNNVIFDNKFSKIDWLQFFDEESESEYIISTKDIYSLVDVVVIKNSDCVFLKNTLDIDAKNPVNFSVFSVEGKKIGKICDILLDEKLKTTCFEIDNKTSLNLHQFLNIGKNVAILKTKKQNKLSNFKSKTKIKVQNLNQNNIVTIEKIKNKITSPKKILTDNYSFLIGRKLDKNIYAENNQLIAKKQSTITSHIIDVASKNGKLKDLTNSSITN